MKTRNGRPPIGEGLWPGSRETMRVLRRMGERAHHTRSQMISDDREGER